MVTSPKMRLQGASLRWRTFPEKRPVVLVPRRPRVGPREDFGPVKLHGDAGGRHADHTVAPRMRWLVVACCADSFQDDQHVRVRSVGGESAQHPLYDAVPG